MPAAKEGSREQEPLSEELSLSASWRAASRAYSKMASAMHHAAAATDAEAASKRSAELINKRYWDGQQNFWITGYTRSGTALIDRQIGPVNILQEGLFSGRQRDPSFNNSRLLISKRNFAFRTVNECDAEPLETIRYEGEPGWGRASPVDHSL